MKWSSPVIFVTHVFFIFLQGLLFNPTKPFSRGAGSQSADADLMIDCFVSCFRINPHNNQQFKVPTPSRKHVARGSSSLPLTLSSLSQVCLASSSPPIFHLVLVNSLHRIITNVRATSLLYLKEIKCPIHSPGVQMSSVCLPSCSSPLWIGGRRSIRCTVTRESCVSCLQRLWGGSCRAAAVTPLYA